LPDGNEIDEDGIDELRVVLREMVATKKKIDAVIAEQGRRDRHA
jgi:hypothetical protein